jgi:hypothetical protein
MSKTKFIVGFLFIAPFLLGAGCSGGSVSSLTNGPKDCGSDLVCFEQQFKNCTLGSKMTAVPASNGDITIGGVKEERCEVTFKVVSGKDSSTVVTTCLFDRTKQYQENNMLILGNPSMFKQYCTQKK